MTLYEQPRLDIFEIAAQIEPAVPPRARRCAAMPERKLREALAAYHLDLPTLRFLASEGGDIRHAVRSGSDLPPEIATLLDLLATLLRPSPREQVKSPADVAALLMIEMSTWIRKNCGWYCSIPKIAFSALRPCIAAA
jgi:hypothetical protein